MEQVVEGGRRNGKTSKALLDAPPDALYVVQQHAAVRYTENLAKELGRADIRVVSYEHIRNRAFYGTNQVVVVDHACKLHPQERVSVSNHNMKAKERAQ